MSGRAPGAGGAAACEGMLAELRKKHEVTSSQPLPARSTVGIVLEGVVVNIIVPGSPSYKRNEAGECIEPGDTVVAIDGAEVTKADIIPKLRGNDVPGSLVSISVLKQGREAPVDFRLTRADMRSVMNLKDLYLALGELHTEMDNPRPDKLRQKIDVLEKRVQAVTNYNDLQEEHMQGHISELEQSVRSLFAQAEQASADKAALDKTSKDLEGLKAQHVALLEECDKLKQKLQAATKDAQDGSQKAASMSVVNMFRGAVASAKQKDAEKRADSAESAAQEASNTADKASQDLHLANEQLQKASRAAEQANKEVERAKGELQRVTEDAEKVRKEAEEMRARAAQELQQAREESERLRKEAAQLRDTAGSASSRAEDAGTQLKKMDQECEKLRQEVSQFRMDANATKSRAEAAEKQLQQAEKDLKAAKEKVQQAERDLDRVRSTGEELKKEVADLKGQQKTGEQRVKDLTNERDDLKRKILDADASQEGGKKELQAAKQQIQDLQGACDRLGAELKSARESEKLASAKLETSSRKVEESSKAVEDLRMQLNPLQATEKKLIAQVSAEKSKAQEFERKMNDLQNIADQKTKDSATAEKRMDELKKVAEQKTQEAAEAEAGAKGLKRQVEQAQLQIARLEKDMQSITSSSSAEHEKSEAALVECTKLRNELREKEAEISSLDFKRDQAEQRTATVEQEMRDTSTRLRTAQKELEDTRKEMRALSEEAARGRILVEEMGKALANKDAQIAAQIKVLRNEKEELHKVAYSLREERRATRSELMKQKSELDTFRAFSAAAKEAVADEKVDIRGERRVLMLEKALEKSEIDRAALEKQVRELLGAAAPKQREVTDETRPEMGSLPIFNTRTDDIHTTAMAGLGCFVVAAGIGYLQRLLGVGGGIGGALMVMSGLAGFVLFVVCLFKFFLYLFGANSEEVLQQRGNYLPINSEPMPVPDKTRKVTPAAYYPAALDAIPRPDPATLQFLTTGRTKVDEQPYQGVAMQSQGRAVSPRDLSPRGQGIAGWSALDIQRAKGASGRSRGSRPLDFV